MAFYSRTITKFTQQKTRYRRRKGDRSQATSRIPDPRNGTKASSVNVLFNFLFSFCFIIIMFKMLVGSLRFRTWTLYVCTIGIMFDGFMTIINYYLCLHSNRKYSKFRNELRENIEYYISDVCTKFVHILTIPSSILISTNKNGFQL